MPWPCFMVTSIRQGEWEPDPEGSGKSRHTYWTLPDGREVRFDDLPPGAMWYSINDPNPYHDQQGSPSLCVVLPGKVIWRMHDLPSRPNSSGQLVPWDIRGVPPLVTASPSINFEGIYHGHVQNGIVQDDVEQRKFDALGHPIKGD